MQLFDYDAASAFVLQQLQERPQATPLATCFSSSSGGSSGSSGDNARKHFIQSKLSAPSQARPLGGSGDLW